jgi:hypothetical protein
MTQNLLALLAWLGEPLNWQSLILMARSHVRRSYPHTSE